ncbi:MAG: protein-L-isoaspartate(D-aspartate) O-methyltransferase, partial [Candidatus Micrarchaeota archaeon]|nr:protein-L-isoaspartate(D-aspartate) O-methyltransferase [Candidatus Micrarchaeota archaeon]
GYTGALISKMVGARTPVYSLEILPEIAEQALRNHVAGHYNVRVLCRDGWAGHPEKAPFDRILVWAAVPTTIVLGNLKGQLAVGGIMIAPVQETHGHQRLAHIRRDGPGPEDFATNYLREPVNFVPLVDSLD